MSDHIKGFYSLELTLTDACNFRCSYCFEGDECLKTTTLDCVEDIFDAIEKMLNDRWFTSIHEGIKIGFWGGEPTLRPDILTQFVERYKDDDRIKFHIYTNGYDIEPLMDIFEECKEKIDVQISYDGKKIHDIKRVLVNGEGTADRVKESIYRLRERGFYGGLKSTVTYDTIQYMPECWDDIKKIYDDLGDGIGYNITIDYFNDDNIGMDVVRKSFIELAKREVEFYKEHHHHLFSWFNSTHPMNCSFFKYGMAINTSGEMLYCHGCGYSCDVKDFTFGHISDDDFLDKLKRNYEYFDLPKIEGCKDCFATHCAMCNVVKYEHSAKENFYDKWHDVSCQSDKCDIFKEFSKVSISLRDIMGGK